MVNELDNRPVVGGFVVLTDMLGHEVARALTDAAGGFVLVAPEPGAYRLHSAIIGWRSTVSPPVLLDRDGTVDYTFVIRPQPVVLAPVLVVGETSCRGSSEVGEAVVGVWDEARKALSAVSWTERATPFEFRWIRYDRTLDSRSLVVLGESTTERQGVFARGPFGTVSADSLWAVGFVRPAESGAWVFEGPDARALLSEEFANLHCFALAVSDEDPGLIGLSFQPVKDRDVPDIDGVLWLDRRSGELRALEFRFTHLPWNIVNEHVGGHVEFQRLPTGAWVVRRWWVRMPIPETTIGLAGRRRVVARRLREQGAVVSEIRDLDGKPVVIGEPGYVTGTVYDSSQAEPIAGARIVLAGTPYQTRADSTGAFALREIPAGTYLLAVVHPALDVAPPVPGTRSITVLPGEGLEVWLGVPSIETLWQSLCPDAPRSDGVGALAGRVTDGLGHPVSGATVSAQGRRWIVMEGPPYARSVDRAVVTGVTGPDGQYAICGFEEGLPIRMQAALGERRNAVPTVAWVDGGRISRVDLTLRPKR
ncbi:MAG TPA: carboxypeptidase regulatory-like domain-containing protein [Gemmatimonadales bacterium]